MPKRLVLALVASVALAACAARTTPSPAAVTPSSPSAGGSASASAIPGALAVTTAQTDLGTFLVDGEGRTLYVFLNDTGTESTCYDQCAANWPPLIADGAVQPGGGLSATDFGTTVRTEGSRQVTFHGHPLYHYAQDQAAGDTKGQGVGQVWYVVGADGEPIR